MFFAFLTALLFAGNLESNGQTATPCRECSLPGARSVRDSVMDVKFRDQTILRNCVSAKRTMMTLYGRAEEGLHLNYWSAGKCLDTIVPTKQISALSFGGLGLGGQSLELPVLPAREFFRNQNLVKPPQNFLEITGLFGYGGSDASTRKIGFASTYFGAELLVAPFGAFLGEKTALALGGGLMSEAGRMRFPVMGHLRFTLFGGARVEDSVSYLPSPCKFHLSGEAAMPAPDRSFVEVPATDERDQTVAYFREKVVKTDDFRLFGFVEGGKIFDSSYDGYGKDPSLNPDEYSEYFAGLGLGMPLWNWATVSLGYRYMRLNLRTPCETCQDAYIVNTNSIHSVLLKFGLRFGW